MPDRPVSDLDHPPPRHHLLVVPVQHPDPGASFQELPTMAMPAEDSVDAVLKETKKLPGPTRDRDRTKIAELLANERCS